MTSRGNVRFSSSNNNNNIDDDDDDEAATKYRKGRGRTRILLAWQQQTAVLILITVVALAVGVLLLWHFCVRSSGSGSSNMLTTTTTATPIAVDWKQYKTHHEVEQALATAVWKEPVPLETYRNLMAQAPGTTISKMTLMAALFAKQRHRFSEQHLYSILKVWLEYADEQIRHNLQLPRRQFLAEYMLPDLNGRVELSTAADGSHKDQTRVLPYWEFFHVFRLNFNATTVSNTTMKWQDEWRELQLKHERDESSSTSSVPPLGTPFTDYTDPAKYTFPEVALDLPVTAGIYPEFRPLGEIMRDWPQEQDYNDNNNNEQQQIHETLQHFDFADPAQLETARKYRDAALPFKLYNVPELTAAGAKWTDEYLTRQFDETGLYLPGSVQEASSNYNLFFTFWDIYSLGLPPVRFNDWNFDTWSQHAKYADAVRLSPDKPHFYFQAAHFLGQLYSSRTKWKFIADDLPSFSYATPEFKETFFAFRQDQQQGLQCRFGERGVLTASHYDGTRNFVAMVTGAKRYILAPPRECSKLGMVHHPGSAMNRHSLLNYRNFGLQDDDNENGEDNELPKMSAKERAWMQKAAGSQAVETVVKAGEVLYLPCHWFHYIVSLQKSAQCNIRSALDEEGNPEFGGLQDVLQCKD